MSNAGIDSFWQVVYDKHTDPRILQERGEGQKDIVYIGGWLTEPPYPLAKYPQGEVKRMWKEKRFKVLLTLVFAVIVMCLLTTKAC